MIYESDFKKIKSVCDLMIEKEDNLAKAHVEKLILSSVDINTPSEKLLLHILATSLLKRIDRDLLDTKNIYLQKFDIPQIELFYRLAKAFPLVSTSHSIANQYIESIVKDLKSFSIFDVGMGRGIQIMSLINTLHEKNYNIKRINIIGLDPDENNINDAAKLFEDLNSKLPFEIVYYPKCILLEDFTDRDFEDIRKIDNETLFINAAFAMHHISHELNDSDYRTEIFRKLAGLNPVLFTLIEPNSNHDTENLSKRLYNSWLHYGSIFKVLDISGIEPEHKFLIKEKFFGREMRDLFGNSDYLRTERHETIESWMLRLVKSNFVPYAYKNLEIKLPSYIEYNISDGCIDFGHDGIPIVGVFAYKLR